MKFFLTENTEIDFNFLASDSAMGNGLARDPNNPNAAKDLIYKTEIAKRGIKAPPKTGKKAEPKIVSEKMIDRIGDKKATNRKS